MAKTTHQYETELARLRAKRAELETEKVELETKLAALPERNRQILRELHQINQPENYSDGMDLPIPSDNVVIPHELEKMEAFANIEKKSATIIKKKHLVPLDRDLRRVTEKQQSLIAILDQLQSTNLLKGKDLIAQLEAIDRQNRPVSNNLEVNSPVRTNLIAEVNKLLSNVDREIELLNKNKQSIMNKFSQVVKLIAEFKENCFEQSMELANLQHIDQRLHEINASILTQEQDFAPAPAQPKAAVAPQAAEDDDILAVSSSSSSSLPSSLSSRSSISTISTLADGNGINDLDEAARTRRAALFSLLNTELTTYAHDNTSSRTEKNKLELLREALSYFDKAKNQRSILAKEQAILVLLNRNIDKQLTAPFHAFLNRMKLAILVYDYQYLNLSGDLERHLRLASPKIQQNIRALYAQLHSMAEYGQKLKKPEQEIVGQLEFDLRRELDDFVARSFDPDFPNSPSTDEMATCFDDFKERFTARLHSQDHMMTQHTKKWRPIVANILAGVATLGIALGVKLIYSKLKEGHASFFMGKTGKEQQVKRVEDTLKNFDDKPNKGPGHQGG